MPADLLDAENLRDVGVIERRQRTRFALETLETFVVVGKVLR